MAQKSLGPNLGNELLAAGLGGVAVGWDKDGNVAYGDGVTDAQKAAVAAVLTAHNATKPDPLGLFRAALAAGVVIVSAGTPALNGTYAIDDATRANITSEALYIQVTSTPGPAKFTNGQPLKNWKDIANGVHQFDTAHFIDFAEAIGAFYDTLTAALDAALAGGAWAAPNNALAIA
jgi:hypothetical protein